MHLVKLVGDLAEFCGYFFLRSAIFLFLIKDILRIIIGLSFSGEALCFIPDY